MKTARPSIRFSLVVTRCGKPRSVTLWGSPDKTFMTAVREDRVMTISLQTIASKKDFGIVGFHQQKNASYFVFPKSLKRFKGIRVVGIKYELVEGAQVGGQLANSKGKKPARRFPPAKPSLSRFQVTTRFTATVEIIDQIEASTRAAARLLGQKASREKEVDFHGTPVTAKIVKVVKL